MATYYRYRLKCSTENTFKYWILEENETPPTKCPTDTAHTVETGSLTVVETITKNKLKIQEESTETGGNFSTTSVVLMADPAVHSVTIKDQTWDTPISALEMQFATEECHRNDKIELIVAPDTITGVLTADAPAGATGISVSQTVIDNTMIGYFLELFDGVHLDKLGRVLSIDRENNRIVTKMSPTHSFSASNPTYVRQNIYIVHDYFFGTPERYVIGASKIGGSYIPAGVIVRAQYTNYSGGEKCAVIQTEYLY